MDEIFDIFNSDPFKMVSLTQSINKLPFVPSWLGASGMFEEQGIRTLTASIEERFGVLQLLPTAIRGAPASVGVRPRRKMRALVVPHIPHDDSILADDLQGLRQFGTPNVLMTVVQAVNDKLAQMRQNHEVTHEHLRVGAVNGLLIDADGASPIYNLFNEFEVAETLVAMNLDNANIFVRSECTAIYRAMEVIMGATPFTGITAICGNNFFDALIDHVSVRTTYLNWVAAEGLRQSNSMRQGFMFGDINWVNYRGFVGNVNFFPTDECRFFPTGSPSLFRTYFSPADMIEAANTVGQPVYAKQERMEFDKGVKIHTQSNPLPLCSRPASLLHGYKYGLPVASRLVEAYMDNPYNTLRNARMENKDLPQHELQATATQLKSRESLLNDIDMLQEQAMTRQMIEKLHAEVAALRKEYGVQPNEEE